MNFKGYSYPFMELLLKMNMIDREKMEQFERGFGKKEDEVDVRKEEVKNPNE